MQAGHDQRHSHRQRGPRPDVVGDHPHEQLESVDRQGGLPFRPERVYTAWLETTAVSGLTSWTT